MDKIEDDIVMAFEQSGVDLLDGINLDPSLYKTTYLYEKKIEKLTLNKINGKKKKSFSFKMGIAVAALLFIVVGTFTFKNQASALLQKMMTWIPGRGVVEQPVNDTTEEHYIFVQSNKGVFAENDDIKVVVNNAFIMDDQLTIDYYVELKKVDIQHVYEMDQQAIENGMTDEEEFAEFAQMYKELGYDKYCNIETTMKNDASDLNCVYSKAGIMDITLTKKELNYYALYYPVSNRVDSTEVYSLEPFKATCDMKDMKECVFSLGDLQVVLEMERAEEYVDETETENSQNICERNGVKMACESYWSGDQLKVELYVIDPGPFSYIDEVLPIFTYGKYEDYFMYVTDGTTKHAYDEFYYSNHEDDLNGVLNYIFCFNMSPGDHEKEWSLHLPVLYGVLDLGEENMISIDIPEEMGTYVDIEKMVTFEGTGYCFEYAYVDKIENVSLYHNIDDPDYDSFQIQYSVQHPTESLHFNGFCSSILDGVENYDVRFMLNLDDMVVYDYLPPTTKHVDLRKLHFGMCYDFVFPIVPEK